MTPAPDAFVIDDEDGICTFVSLTLSTLGLSARTFNTAHAAIAALEQGQPVIIFLDIALQGSDAIDVLRTLGEKRYAGVVQLMSGSNQSLLEDVRRVGARHGLNMRPPLEKPFRTDAIRQAVADSPFEGQADAALVIAPENKLSLEEALANDWLELWYQPKFDLRSRALVGAEGLIRCLHPVKGLLPPASFLDAASESSLEALTEFVVVNALRHWEEVDETGTQLTLAVNTTVGALANLQLPRLVREHRPKSQRWPGLILEVTESDVIRDVPLVHEIATQLRIYGISLAIDDFGEGYSSFARLRELPFSELKLDRSFVDGCAEDGRNAGISKAVIELAHHFGAQAVAEGLENEADLQAVHRMGCDIGQGYLFAKPMQRSEFLAMLRNRTWPTATAPA
jgi:EAL domain-containing protein (putative c-di-GMP-specific phosphodiesterase class I)